MAMSPHMRSLRTVSGGGRLPTFVVRYPNGDETQYVSAMFECEVVSGFVRPDGEEVQRVQFWTRDEAEHLPLAPWLRGVVPRIFDRTDAAWFEPPTWRADT